MPQNLVHDLTVTLAAGASTTVAHTLESASGSGLTPSEIRPDRGTNIIVTSSNTSTITFTNNGLSSETAIFRCWVYFSPGIEPGTATLGWQGSSSSSGSSSSGVLVYDPLAVAGGNVYTTPATLAAAAAAISGGKTIYIMDSDDDGTVTFGPAATGLNFANCAFVGPSNKLTITVDIVAGTVFSGFPTSFTNLSVTIPAGLYTVVDTIELLTIDGGVFTGPSGASDGITVGGTNVFGLTVKGGAIIQGGTTNSGTFTIAVGALVSVSVYDQCQISQTAFEGSGTLSVTMYGGAGSVRPQTNAGWLGIQTTSLLASDIIVYNSAGTAGGNVATTWARAYALAAAQPGIATIEVVGSAGTIPSGTYDLSRIKLTGADGTVLTVLTGAVLGSTTQMTLEGGLTFTLDTAAASPFSITSGSTARSINVSDRARFANNSTNPFFSISAGYSGTINIISQGSQDLPMASGGPLITTAGTGLVTFTGERANQTETAVTGGTLRQSFEIVLTGQTAGGATVSLADALTAAFVKLPQFSTAVVTGEITARALASGTTNSGSWIFRAQAIRDAAVGSVVVSGSTVTIVAAGTYAMAPTIIADTTNGGVAVSCTGVGGSTTRWVCTFRATLSGTTA